VNNKRYVVPDGVRGQTVHRTIQKNETRLTDTWSDYFSYSMKSLSLSASIKYEGFELKASFEGTKGKINNLLKNGTRSFAFHGGTWLTYALQFKGMNRPPLDRDFVKNINSLPNAYSYPVYYNFIRAWGTHYFTRAIYGCEFTITVAASKKFQQNRDAKWTTKQMDLTLGYKEFAEFKIGHKSEVNKSAIDGKFLDDAKLEANARGGDESKFVQGHDFGAWLESCSTLKQPIQMYSDAMPISDLITDATKKANVRQAILTYGKAVKVKK